MNLSLCIVFPLFIISCGSNATKKNKEEAHDGMHKDAVKPTLSTGNFGAEITVDNALPASELQKLLEGKEQVETKPAGKIDAVCQMTGCRMNVEMDNGETVHVTLKDDAFLLPKDAAG